MDVIMKFGGKPTSGALTTNETAYDDAYKPGDTIDIGEYIPLAGVLTSSTTTMNFWLPLPKSTRNVTGATISTLTGGIRVPGGGYISNGSVGSDASNWLTGSNIKEARVEIRPLGVRIVIVGKAALKVGSNNAVNNTPVNGLINAVFTFT